jgi:hypothetical protein
MPHFGPAVGIAAAALCVFMFGCSVAGSDPTRRLVAAVAPYPPPAKRAEIPPPVPATDALWLVGHWQWNGSKFAWTAGRYIQRPSPSANWLPGYWEQDFGGWRWTEGHWET